jgi:hypothetical protein
MPRKRRPKPNPIIDEFARVKALRRDAEKQYNDLRTRIISLGLSICPGNEHTAILIECTRTSLDTQLLKADYGEEWYDEYCRTTNYYEVKVIPNA